jgi:LPXTG-site transpeptidase (sortase) family protein
MPADQEREMMTSGHRQRRDAERPLRAAGRPGKRVGLDPGLLVGSTDDEIRRHFLRLVRGWRRATPRTAVRLRQADVAVLVSILGTDRAEMERRLVAVTACTIRAARRGRRVLLASIGALSVGAGRFTFTHLPASADAGRAMSSSAVAGQARVSFERVDPRAPLTTAAPVAVASTEPAAVLPAGAEAMLSVPSLGIDLPIVAGGQSVIEQGVVAHYIAPGWERPVAAGAAGTYWLAAHHTTHGGPFRTLPDLAVGAEVRVTTSAHTFVYTVTSTEVVGLWPGDDAVYGTDPTASVILLQTCVDNTLRVLVHGTLIATL